MERSRQSADQLADQLRRTDDAAQGLGEGVAAAGGSFAALAASAVAALAGFAGLSGTVAAANELADELGKVAAVADLVGVSAQSVEGFSRVLGQFGLDAEGARDVLVDMSEAVGDALQDTEGSIAKAFAGLKVNLRDANGQAVDAREGFLRLADGLATLSDAEATFRAKEIGITDREALFALRLGRQELDRRWKAEQALSKATAENITLAREYTFATATLSTAFGAVGAGILTSLMPAFTELARALTPVITWLASHGEIVEGFFLGVAGVVTAIYLPAMLRAAAATLAATWPFIAAGLAIAAVGAAFALAYDDIQAFMSGGASVTGMLLQQFPALSDAAGALVETLRGAWDALQAFGAQAAEVFAPLASSAAEVFGAVGSLLGAFLSLLAGVGAQVWDLIDGQVLAAFRGLQAGVGAVMGAIVDAVRAAVGFLTAAFGQIAGGIQSAAGALRTVGGWLGIGDGVPEAVAAGQRQMAEAAASPLNAQTSASISNAATSNRRESSVTVGEVNIQTQATDAQGIAGDARSALADQLASLDDEFASGVDR